jgi:hypothetical protein
MSRVIEPELEVPVAGLARLRGRAADRAARSDQLQRRERPAAGLALVALGVVELALRVGAGAGHVAVGQESVALGAEELLLDLALDVPGAVELEEELLAEPGVGRARGPAVDVEADVQPLEGRGVGAVELVDDVLGRDPGLVGGDGDGHAVLVRAADVERLAPGGAEVPHVDVRGQVGPGDVADVDAPVGIGQGAGDQVAFRHDFGFRNLWNPLWPAILAPRAAACKG